MRRARWRLALAAVLLLPVLAFGGYWAYLGYFGGQVFVPVAAQGSPVPARRGVVAVLLSGDMGFNVGMGPRVAERLARDGIPVVGVNSLAYFRHKRTPAQAGALIEDAMARARAMAPAGEAERRIVVIGQSFGADMVNVGSPTLAPQWRRRILATLLVVPTDTIDLQASPAEMMGWVRPDASAIPTARRLGWVPTWCIYGRKETESLCPHVVHQPGVRTVALPGGHTLDWDVDAVHAVVIGGIDAALAARDRAAQARKTA